MRFLIGTTLAASLCAALTTGATAQMQASAPAMAAIYTKDNAPKAPAVGDLEQRDSVSQWGITWKFDRKVPVGRFVNGDWYVVGPATVVDIDPRPLFGKDVPEDQRAKGDAANAEEEGLARNGSMLNMEPRTGAGKGDKLGFDSRIRQRRYDPKLFVKLPVSLKPGDILVSTISMKHGERVKRIDGQGGGSEDKPTVHAAALTCLAEPVSADAFRPSYGDRTRKIYYARDLRRALLPKVQAPPSLPKVDEYIDMFARPWLDTLMFTNAAPTRNMPQYGREVGRHVGIGALMLCTNLKAEEEEKLLVNFVQVGIDLGGLVRAGHEGWPAFGGHCTGRKLPIVFAGVMLNDEELSNPSKLNPKVQFQEDMQTIYGDGWTGAKALYGGHVGPEGKKGTPGWGAYEHLPPGQWKEHGGKDWELGEGYRRCCTSSAWIGQDLALKLMKIEKTWNHGAFFDYCDRWMTEKDDDFIYIILRDSGQDWRDKTWAKQGTTWDKFVDEMWAKYRSTVEPAPTGWKSDRPVPKFEGDPSKLPPPAKKGGAATE